MRAALAIGALLASLLGPATQASPPPPVPRLKGRTVVSGARNAWMPVRLTKPVRLSTKPFRNPTVKFGAGGDISGVVLKEDVPHGGVELVAMRADLCGACKGPGLGTVHVRDPSLEYHPNMVTFPKGDYLLYVISNGGRTEVELSLPGLAGRTRLSPDMRAEATFGDADTFVSEPPVGDPLVYSAKHKHRLTHAGISLVAFEMDTEAFAAMSLSSCVEPVDNEIEDPAGNVCEGGMTAGSGAFTRHDLAGGRKIVVSTGLADPNVWNHQLSYRSGAVIKSFEAREFSLSYVDGNRDGKWQYSLSFSF